MSRLEAEGVNMTDAEKDASSVAKGTPRPHGEGESRVAKRRRREKEKREEEWKRSRSQHTSNYDSYSWRGPNTAKSEGEGKMQNPWHPRLCAMRSPVAHRGLETDTPWTLARFATPPTGSDRWECLGSGDGAGEWWVRVLRKSKVRAFHSLHLPRFMIERTLVAFHRQQP